MKQPTENPGIGVDDTFERPPAPPPTLPTRNRGPSRCYNFTLIVAYFVVLIIAVVALGSFGKKQADISQRFHEFGYIDKTCILFGTTISYDSVNKVRYVDLHPAGLCGYVLWGLVSVAIVIFVWLVYSIVQTAIGPKVISILRVLDLVVIALTCLLSISLSITIHSGLDATCRVDGRTFCGPFVPQGTQGTLEFFDEINSAKVSSWITSMLLLGLSVWYTILMIVYCYSGSQRRKQAQQYAHLERQDKELPDHV